MTLLVIYILLLHITWGERVVLHINQSFTYSQIQQLARQGRLTSGHTSSDVTFRLECKPLAFTRWLLGPVPFIHSGMTIPHPHPHPQRVHTPSSHLICPYTSFCHNPYYRGWGWPTGKLFYALQGLCTVLSAPYSRGIELHTSALNSRLCKPNQQ